METAVRHSHDHRYSLDGHIITRKIFHVNRNLYFLIIIFVYLGIDKTLCHRPYFSQLESSFQLTGWQVLHFFADCG